MKMYWIVLPDCTSCKKHQAFFIKRAPNLGPQDRVPEARAPAKFYVTLWLQFVVWRQFCWQHPWQHQCVRLGVMGRENPPTKRFLMQFQKLHTLWSIDSQDNSKIGATYQMSDFKAKMHQIRFPLGLCPRPWWGSLQRSPRPPTCI